MLAVAAERDLIPTGRFAGGGHRLPYAPRVGIVMNVVSAMTGQARWSFARRAELPIWNACRP